MHVFHKFLTNYIHFEDNCRNFVGKHEFSNQLSIHLTQKGVLIKHLQNLQRMAEPQHGPPTSQSLQG